MYDNSVSEKEINGGMVGGYGGLIGIVIVILLGVWKIPPMFLWTFFIFHYIYKSDF